MVHSCRSTTFTKRHIRVDRSIGRLRERRDAYERWSRESSLFYILIYICIQAVPAASNAWLLQNLNLVTTEFAFFWRRVWWRCSFSSNSKGCDLKKKIQASRKPFFSSTINQRVSDFVTVFRKIHPGLMECLFLYFCFRMLDSYERGEVTPPPVSSYGGSPGLLALHSSLYATPTSRAFDIDSGIDGNEGSMSMDTQMIPVSFSCHREEKFVLKISLMLSLYEMEILSVHFIPKEEAAKRKNIRHYNSRSLEPTDNKIRSVFDTNRLGIRSIEIPPLAMLNFLRIVSTIFDYAKSLHLAYSHPRILRYIGQEKSWEKKESLEYFRYRECWAVTPNNDWRTCHGWPRHHRSTISKDYRRFLVVLKCVIPVAPHNEASRSNAYGDPWTRSWCGQRSRERNWPTRIPIFTMPTSAKCWVSFSHFLSLEFYLFFVSFFLAKKASSNNRASKTCESIGRKNFKNKDEILKNTQKIDWDRLIPLKSCWWKFELFFSQFAIILTFHSVIFLSPLGMRKFCGKFLSRVQSSTSQRRKIRL